MNIKHFDPENWTPSRFTRAMRYVLPGYAFKRMKHEFAYDAAQATTKRKYAPQNINPNDYQTQRDRLQLMREAFDLEKNFAPAKAINRKHALFSSPTSYYAQTGDSVLSKEVEEYLHEDWFQNCDISCRYDFFEMMRFGILGMNSGGDYGWGYVRPGATEDMDMEDLVKLPLMIQGVEPDRIGGIYQNVVSNDYVAGVIIGEYGQPTHYRIFKRSLVVSQYTDPIDVPANQFVHMTDPMRIDTYRGVSKLDVGSANARDFYETWDAMRGKQKLAASLTVFTNSNGAVAGQGTLDPYATAQAAYGYTGMQQDIHQNMINHLTGGSEIKFPETATPGGEGQYLLTLGLKFLSLCYDLPYSFALDATDLGGVSTRLESEIAKAEFQRTQKIITRKANVLKNAAILDACAKGIFPAKYYTRLIKGRWGFRPHPQPDLGKEAQAASALRQQGLLSEPQYVIENYGDVKAWAMEKDRFVSDCKEALSGDNTFEEVFGSGPIPQGAAASKDKSNDGTGESTAKKEAGSRDVKEFATDVSSEARDESGKWTSGGGQGKMVLHHGTRNNNPPENFDYDRIGDENGHTYNPQFGYGIYFSNHDAALAYAGGKKERVGHYEVDIKNPLKWNEPADVTMVEKIRGKLNPKQREEFDRQWRRESNNGDQGDVYRILTYLYNGKEEDGKASGTASDRFATQKLIRAGFDGSIVGSPNDVDYEVVAFKPEQIKKISNAGTGEVANNSSTKSEKGNAEEKKIE